MCEPITGAAYLMTLLAYSGQFDMRVYSPQVNAGVYKQIYINGGCYADWEQWSNVPYYTDKVGDNIGEYDIKRVALANDSSNIYLKIDTTEWNLPGYCDFNTFAVRVVVDDTYLLTRNSYSDAYALYRNVNGSWQYDRDITSVIAPQWEPESGRIEMAIPYEAIGCSYPSEGMWNNLKISITQGDGVNGLVSDTFKAHYRMTGCFMEWLLGNFE